MVYLVVISRVPYPIALSSIDVLRCVDMEAVGRKIFVGGLPIEANNEMINADFGKFGEIEDIYLPADRETGKLRGFCFVTFKDPRDAKDAADSMHG